MIQDNELKCKTINVVFIGVLRLTLGEHCEEQENVQKAITIGIKFFKKKLFLLCCIFSITVYPSYATPDHHHTVVHGPSSLWLDPSTPIPPPELSACSLSMSLSLCCLLVQSVH